MALVNGTACDDENPCTKNDTCQLGVCAGGSTVLCPAQDQCPTGGGACDPVNGCPSTAKPDGAACDDGDLCTQGDTCQAGVCAGGTATVCTALDTCHVAGTCDPATGVCTNVAKPDSASCSDSDACTRTDTCPGGVCKGTNPVECKAKDECHGAGSCDSETGTCSTPSKPDGVPCADGACNAGVCAPIIAGSSPASAGTSSGSTGSGSGSGGGSASPGPNGGCGCDVVGTPGLHPAWLGLGLLLVRRRRPRGVSPRQRGTTG